MASPMIPHGAQGQRGVHLGYKRSRSTGTRRFHVPSKEDKPVDDGFALPREWRNGWCDRCFRNRGYQKRKDGRWLCLGCECNVEAEPPPENSDPRGKVE
jgi:hypothetical protein